MRRARELGTVVEQASAVRAHPGYGIEGDIGGRHIVLGAPTWIEEHAPALSRDRLNTLAGEGKTVIAMADASRFLGLIAIADRLRASSPGAVAKLKSLGIDVLMLTGDNDATARTMATAAGIERWKAGLTPPHKAAEIERLKTEYGLVGMAGDGINDAPALAAADVSFAFAGGADIAIEAADVTLMRNDLMSAADAVRLSRATLAKIRQNLFFAFVYNALGIPLAAFGLLNPVIAAAAMALSSVSVVANSLLLKRWRAGA
jgi:Cu+-exporting ATPase